MRNFEYAFVFVLTGCVFMTCDHYDCSCNTKYFDRITLNRFSVNNREYCLNKCLRKKFGPLNGRYFLLLFFKVL